MRVPVNSIQIWNIWTFNNLILVDDILHIEHWHHKKLNVKYVKEHLYWPIHNPVFCALINTFAVLQKCPVSINFETHPLPYFI